MKNPILKSLAEEFPAGLDISPFREKINDPHIGKVKFGGGDDPSFRTAPVGGKKSAQEGIAKDFEVTANGFWKVILLKEEKNYE